MVTMTSFEFGILVALFCAVLVIAIWACFTLPSFTKEYRWYQRRLLKEKSHESRRQCDRNGSIGNSAYELRVDEDKP